MTLVATASIVQNLGLALHSVGDLGCGVDLFLLGSRPPFMTENENEFKLRLQPKVWAVSVTKLREDTHDSLPYLFFNLEDAKNEVRTIWRYNKDETWVASKNLILEDELANFTEAKKRFSYPMDSEHEITLALLEVK